MKEHREMRRGIRAKGARESVITEIRREGPTGLIVRGVRLAKVISAGMALKGIITGLAAIITAVKEAARGRTIDSGVLKNRVKVSLSIPRLRTRNAATRRSAESVRRRTESPKRISSMRMKTQR